MTWLGKATLVVDFQAKGEDFFGVEGVLAVGVVEIRLDAFFAFLPD